MKFSSFVLATFITGTLMLSGCGKSAAEKNAESELNDKIMKAHETQMTMAARVDELLAKIDTLVAKHDSLAKAFPKEMANISTAELTSAKDKLSAAKDGMDSWMSSHEPYNASVKHEIAMQQLTGDLNVVTQVGDQMNTAIAAATSALNANAQTMNEVLAKSPKGKKK